MALWERIPPVRRAAEASERARAEGARAASLLERQQDDALASEHAGEERRRELRRLEIEAHHRAQAHAERMRIEAEAERERAETVAEKEAQTDAAKSRETARCAEEGRRVIALLEAEEVALTPSAQDLLVKVEVTTEQLAQMRAEGVLRAFIDHHPSKAVRDRARWVNTMNRVEYVELLHRRGLSR